MIRAGELVPAVVRGLDVVALTLETTGLDCVVLNAGCDLDNGDDVATAREELVPIGTLPVDTADSRLDFVTLTPVARGLDLVTLTAVNTLATGEEVG